MIVVAVVNARLPRSPRILKSFAILSGPALAATSISISGADDDQEWRTRDDRPRNDLGRSIRNANRDKPDSRTEERDAEKERPQAELEPAAFVFRRIAHRLIIPDRRQPEQGILGARPREPRTLRLQESGMKQCAGGNFAPSVGLGGGSVEAFARSSSILFCNADISRRTLVSWETASGTKMSR